MLALGREARVEGRGDQHLDDRLLRPAVHLRVDLGAVHVVEARRHDDAGGQVIALLGQHRELGSSDRATFIRKVALSHFQACIRLHDVGVTAPAGPAGRTAASDLRRRRPLRAPSFAACDNANRAAAIDDDFLDRGAEEDVDARFAAGAGHRLGDRAHAADRMAPGARNSGRLAEQMVPAGRRRCPAIEGRAKLPTTPSNPNSALARSPSKCRSRISVACASRSRGRSGSRRSRARPCRGRD